MGDLAADTAVVASPEGGGTYTCEMSRDWEIWGPNGGYMASIGLRAAGAHSRFERPATIVGHYLGVASFDAPVDIETTTLREAKRAESIRVSVRQEHRPIFEALVWAVGDVEGLEHHVAEMPAAPDPITLISVRERLAARGDEGMYHRFWSNFDERPPEWIDDWENRTSGPPSFVSWFRYVPAETFTDPWVDACRSLILVDTLPWPAVHRHYVEDHGFMAPSLDITVSFQHLDPTEPWLLAHASARSAHDGLIAGHVDVWSRAGRLVASGTSTLLCRPMRPEYRYTPES